MGTPMAVQRLRLCASNAGGIGSIPDWGMNISHVVPCHQKRKSCSNLHQSFGGDLCVPPRQPLRKLIEIWVSRSVPKSYYTPSSQSYILGWLSFPSNALPNNIGRPMGKICALCPPSHLNSQNFGGFSSIHWSF